MEFWLCCCRPCGSKKWSMITPRCTNDQREYLMKLWSPTTFVVLMVIGSKVYGNMQHLPWMSNEDNHYKGHMMSMWSCYYKMLTWVIPVTWITWHSKLFDARGMLCYLELFSARVVWANVGSNKTCSLGQLPECARCIRKALVSLDPACIGPVQTYPYHVPTARCYIPFEPLKTNFEGYGKKQRRLQDVWIWKSVTWFSW